MPGMSQIDYLAVGHFARDMTLAGAVTGGTVAYAGATAWALGCRTAIFTSYAPDFKPSIGPAEVVINSVPSSATTTFTNIYHDNTRSQQLHSRASQLTPQHLPPAWKGAAIVHLAPIADEVDPAMASIFNRSLLAITPQGWLRTWTEDGRVHPTYWKEARTVLPHAAAVVLSEEDVADPAWIGQFRKWARLLVLTRGAHGCTVYMQDEMREIPAPTVVQQDPTGAGDIFAAAFFMRLLQTRGNPWEAARYANNLAACSVTAGDLPSKIQRLQEEISSP